MLETVDELADKTSMRTACKVMGGDAALAQIAEWRQGTLDGWKRSPETEEQWQQVRTW